MTGQILFFDFAFEEYLPVIEETVARGADAIMNRPAMLEMLAERGTEAKAFMDYAQDGDGEYAVRSGKALGQRFAAGVSQPGAAGAFDSLGGNLLMSGGRDLVQSVLATAQNQVLIGRVMRRLLQNSNLQVVVMRSCRSGGERIVQLLASREGVPVIELAYGNSLGSIKAEIASHLAVSGARQRDAFVDSGTNPGQIHVTGMPAWDPLYSTGVRQTKTEARDELGLPHDQPLVLYAASFASGETLSFPDEALGMIRANELFAKAISGIVPAPLVAVRPHPSESGEKPGRRPTAAELADFRRWFVERGVNLLHVDYSRTTVVREKASLIQAADVVVTSSSSLVTEVLILDRPCIILDGRTTSSERFYQASDGVLHAHNAAELSAHLDRILTDHPYRESLQKAAQSALPTLNGGHDGKSAIRLADLIARLAESKSGTTSRTP